MSPVAADVGSPLSVRVTASKAGFTDGVATSNPTAAVQPASVPSVVAGAPTIKGKADGRQDADRQAGLVVTG